MPAHRASSQNGYRKANACPRMVILTSTIPQPEQVKYSLIKEKNRQLGQMKISQPYMQPSGKHHRKRNNILAVQLVISCF